MQRMLFNLLVDREVKEEFLKIAKQEGTLGSVLIRQFMKEYIKKHKSKD